jgi:hypothetical protein
MPKFLEKKLKSQYGKDSSVPYKIMNSIGAMKGSKETEKGKEMESKHNRDLGIGGKKTHKTTGLTKKKKSFTEALNV